MLPRYVCRPAGKSCGRKGNVFLAGEKFVAQEVAVKSDIIVAFIFHPLQRMFERIFLDLRRDTSSSGRKIFG